jgi:hypothetical protein
MSTSYYRLRAPFTRIETETDGERTWVKLWNAEGPLGALAVQTVAARDTVLGFADQTCDSDCPMRTHWGGSAVGCVVTENSALDPETTLVSEYGEVLTVRQVRERAGHGRGATSLAQVGELFGYGG